MDFQACSRAQNKRRTLLLVDWHDSTIGSDRFFLISPPFYDYNLQGAILSVNEPTKLHNNFVAPAMRRLGHANWPANGWPFQDLLANIEATDLIQLQAKIESLLDPLNFAAKINLLSLASVCVCRKEGS